MMNTDDDDKNDFFKSSKILEPKNEKKQKMINLSFNLLSNNKTRCFKKRLES